MTDELIYESRIQAWQKWKNHWSQCAICEVNRLRSHDLEINLCAQGRNLYNNYINSFNSKTD